MRFAIHTLVKNTEPDVLLDSTLINYGKMKSAERYFDRVPKFLVRRYCGYERKEEMKKCMCIGFQRELAFAETIESNLLKHNYEMGKFLALPFINFGLQLKSTERAKLDYPRDGYILRRRNVKKSYFSRKLLFENIFLQKAAIDCVETMLENIPGADAPFLSKKTFVLEYLSNLY